MPTPTATDEVRDGARLLARLIEPIVAQVYFAPECHARYAALGFNDSRGATSGGVALPDGPAYFTSRGSALGQAPVSWWRPPSGCSTRRWWCRR